MIREAGIVAAPEDHFTAGPDRGVIIPGIGRITGVCSSPAICTRIISPAAIQRSAATRVAAPEDHFTAGPNRSVILARGGGAAGAGGRPGVGGRIVSPAAVEKSVEITGRTVAAPEDHFSARPNRSVRVARGGGRGGASRRPSMGRRIVAPAAGK